MTDPRSDFERGHDAGGIAERLAAHDKHFAQLNGSMADVATALNKLTLAVQRVSDQQVSSAATVITTAAALKDANESRRAQSESSWSPWAKAFAVLAAIATAVGLYALLKGK